MMEMLVPKGVVTTEVIGHDPEAVLLPEEAVALGRVAKVRRHEFTLGRTCARRALMQLGLSPVPILSGPRREPRWPNSVVGSITHCRGYAAAAVALRAHFVAIGIDAEDNDDLPNGVLGMIATKGERAWLAEAGGGVHWDRVLFSAKESLFKAWYPLTGRWLGFEDAIVTIAIESRTFEARVLLEGAQISGRVVDTFCGRYLVDGGFVLTAVTVAAD